MASDAPRDHAVFASAATAFADLVTRIPDPAWDGPGLGDWDLRALVGHTSRSLITVSTYLRTPADREDVTGPAHYYALLRGYAADSPDIVERGREAGRNLGADPATKVTDLLHRVLTDLDAAGDPLITVIGGLGIRLSSYLPTRVFELTVHSLDIARATGIDLTLPEEALREATVLAAQIAALTGQAAAVLPALTGRSGLPAGFSVV
ncbi:maleylpyruvate isomerase N-terminal domain-containing protein [Mycolicibacterium mucogenicum]|uniref:maleylpyruvate isomerase N-terminal domain-containing protein n=1 Tax=Mycolicibacterium mucogenicum TaxID=56689 RepID=UPI00226A29DE|nr:maleylpyruvate isomerase N-terminal domain-containing protein [Mycolicibacterium mucogenicum]MCX8559985.1 maleylpyruvate isomerase N-terminal domain-containing protein [Mycolicibacterium mucogenicum]